MPDPSPGSTVQIDPNADYPTTGTCEERHDMALTFSGAELIRLEAGDTVEGYTLKKRDGYIYGRCTAPEGGGTCNHTCRLSWPQIDTAVAVEGWRTCTACMHLVERAGPRRLPAPSRLPRKPDGADGETDEDYMGRIDAVRGGAIDDAGRRATGKPPGDFCWCGEKPMHVPERW